MPNPEFRGSEEEEEEMMLLGADYTTLVAGVLAIIILIDVSVLAISGRPVPELLSNLAFGVFGFYFGRRAPGQRDGSADHEAAGGQ